MLAQKQFALHFGVPEPKPRYGLAFLVTTAFFGAGAAIVFFAAAVANFFLGAAFLEGDFFAGGMADFVLTAGTSAEGVGGPVRSPQIDSQTQGVFTGPDHNCAQPKRLICGGLIG